MLDKNMIYLAASQRWITDLVHGESNIIGRSHYDVFPEIPERWKEIHRRCLAGTTESSEEDAFPRGDGTIDYLRWEIRPWRDYQGSIGGIIIFSEDITKRKRAEQALLESEHKRREQEIVGDLHKAHAILDSVFERFPSIVYVKDASSGRIVRGNRAAEMSIGVPREQLIGKTVHDLFPKEIADHFTANDQAALASGKAMEIPEETAIVPILGTRLIRTTLVPIMNDGGKPEYLLVVLEDITEARRAEEDRRRLFVEQCAREEAERAVHLRDDFISIASHELKTPLTALRMQLQVIPRYLKDTAVPGKGSLQTLFRNSLRQLEQFSGLVDNLLDVSRASAARMTLNLERVDLSQAVRTVVEHYQSELKEAGCSVEENLASIQGYWDPIRIEQVVVNLLTNAMKYGAGKPIEISTWIDGDQARLVVSDHGIGIKKEDQKKIFERFERVAPLTGYRGLGLGLYITREIVKGHGGSIRVESEPGRGSTFIVELPLQAKEQNV